MSDGWLTWGPVAVDGRADPRGDLGVGVGAGVRPGVEVVGDGEVDDVVPRLVTGRDEVPPAGRDRLSVERGELGLPDLRTGSGSVVSHSVSTLPWAGRCDGVRAVTEHVLAELDLTMALAGVSATGQIRRHNLAL